MDQTIRLDRKFDSLYRNTKLIIFRRIYAYSTVSTSTAAYIIGGNASDRKDIITEFKNDSWLQFGTLTKGRYYHGSISMGERFMVIGGLSSGRLVNNFETDRNSTLFSVIWKPKSGISQMDTVGSTIPYYQMGIIKKALVFILYHPTSVHTKINCGVRIKLGLLIF